MALESIDKMRIGKYMKITAFEDLCWGGFYEGVKKNKYNDYDVLVFLVDSFINKLKGNDVVTEKLLTKYVGMINNFYWWATEKELPAVAVTAKIRVLKELYLEYAKKHEIEPSDQLVVMIEDMLTEIDKEHGEEKTSTEEVSKFVASILELEAQIKQLKSELAEAQRQIINYERSSVDSSKKSKKHDDVISGLRDKVQGYEDEISRLTSEIEPLRKRANCTQEEYEMLISKLDEAQGKVAELTGNLTALKSLYDEQAAKLSKLEEKEKERVTEEEQRNSRLAFEAALDDKVIALLFKGQYTAVELVQELKKQGGSYSLIEVSESLSRVKLKLCIMNGKALSYPQVFGVCPPIVKTHSNINLGETGEVLDILIISDLHITEMSNKVIKRLNSVYEYCAKYGIRYILNLGDIFDLNPNSKFNSETFVEHQRLIDAIVRNFPHDDSIVHFVLGGNHDRNATAFGIDSIETLASRRSDIINLGYSHATIGVAGSTNKELIGIHHPKGWVVETIDDFDLGAGQITRYLEQSCSGLEKNYIDLFGHLHASRIDTVNGYGTVPSLFYDKERSGAWHVKVYLDKNKNIKYMVFIQLLAEKSLTKISEVGYQRIMK